MIIPRITNYMPIQPIRFEKSTKQPSITKKPAISLTGKPIENAIQILCNKKCTIIVNKYGKLIDKEEGDECCKFNLKKGESYILDSEGRIDSIRHLDGTQSIFDYFFGRRCIFPAKIDYAYHLNPKTGIITQTFPDGSINTETRKENFRIKSYKDKNRKFFMKKIYEKEELVFHLQRNNEGLFNCFMKTKTGYQTKNNISLEDCKKLERQILLHK